MSVTVISVSFFRQKMGQHFDWACRKVAFSRETTFGRNFLLPLLARMSTFGHHWIIAETPLWKRRLFGKHAVPAHNTRVFSRKKSFARSQKKYLANVVLKSISTPQERMLQLLEMIVVTKGWRKMHSSVAPKHRFIHNYSYGADWIVWHNFCAPPMWYFVPVLLRIDLPFIEETSLVLNPRSFHTEETPQPSQGFVKLTSRTRKVGMKLPWKLEMDQAWRNHVHG